MYFIVRSWCLWQRKHDSSSSEDSDVNGSKYMTPDWSSTPVTPAAGGSSGSVDKKHKKKHKKAKDDKAVDTPAEDIAEKKVELVNWNGW